MRHGIAFTALFLALAFPAAADAQQTLSLQLMPTLTTTQAGDTINYTATVTNITNGPVTLNEDSIVLDNGLNATRIGGIVNLVPYVIQGNTSLTTDAFSLLISPSTQPGDYQNNDYTVNDFFGNFSNTVPFEVDVLPGAVPEPNAASLLLSLCAIALFALLRRRAFVFNT